MTSPESSSRLPAHPVLTAEFVCSFNGFTSLADLSPKMAAAIYRQILERNVSLDPPLKARIFELLSLEVRNAIFTEVLIAKKKQLGGNGRPATGG